MFVVNHFSHCTVVMILYVDYHSSDSHKRNLLCISSWPSIAILYTMKNIFQTIISQCYIESMSLPGGHGNALGIPSP